MTDGYLELAGGPGLEGLRFRQFRGETDYPLILAVLTASESADGTERAETLESIAHGYTHLSNCDPIRDMVFAEVAGEAVGYCRGWWWDEATGGRVYGIVGFVTPQWRRRGIGSAMLGWAESRMRFVAEGQPEARDASFHVGAAHRQVGLIAMLDGAGYAPVRTFYEMVRPTLDGIPDAPLPDGTELRAVLPQHYREIWRSVDETSKDEWGYEPADEEGYQEWLSHPHFQPDLWQIAWDTATNAVAGHLLTFIDHADNAERQRKRGLTEGLGVEQPWRRRGLARALVSRSLQAQAAAGMTESALNADSDNSGKVIALYQSAGFHVTERSTVYRKPL